MVSSGVEDNANNDITSVAGSFWFGPQPMLLPGPTYKKVGGDASGFLPTDEVRPPLDSSYFLGNMFPVKTTKTVVYQGDAVNTSTIFVLNLIADDRGHNTPMACYSTKLSILDVRSSRIDTDGEDRDLFIGDKAAYISSHILRGTKDISDYEIRYWAGSQNLPSNDITKGSRKVPTLGDQNTYPSSAPQVLTLREAINSAVEHEGNVLIATDNKVLQIPQQSLGPNNFAVSRNIMSRGLDTNIVHESAQYYGAQGDQLISFNFYEQNQGYRGHNETKEYNPGILTQVETFIQKHNLLVAVEGGSKSIHILTFGGDRRTNGFSRFDFPFVVTGVRKLDHDRMLIFFEGERPRVLDFASRDKGIRYADYISDTEFKIYKSTAATLPVVNLGADSFKSVKYSSIKNVMVYLAEQITAFTISIKSKHSTVKRQVNINDILVDANPYSAARPFLLEGMSLNTTVAPIVAIETQSDENLESHP